MDFYRDVGQGYGEGWLGTVFRRTYPELREIVRRSHQWFNQLPERPVWNGSDTTWTWPTKESLSFRYARTVDDYWRYHGSQLPWLAFEELTTWPDLDVYLRLMSCCRPTGEEVPFRIRANTNPYGPGHGAVKARFVDPAPSRTIIRDKEGNRRIRITSHLRENKVLLGRDPDYAKRIAANMPEHVVKAWLRCDWDIVAGGMFDDVFRRPIHVLPRVRKIPETWRVDRSYDWGQSRPWAVLWHAEADGEAPMELEGGREITPVRGSVITFAERYGWTGKPNEGDRATTAEQAREVLRIEKEWSDLPDDARRRVHPGPADSAIYAVKDGKSDADTQEELGVSWIEQPKGPGSRATGWGIMRARLKAADAEALEQAEEPGWWITASCKNLIRTLSGAQRADTNPDDLDKNYEDHALDAARYRLMAEDAPTESVGSTGWN